MSQINLLDETIATLLRHGKSPADVIWVGACASDNYDAEVKPFSFSWPEFCTVADVVYDNLYGSHEINGNLVVVGSDWWLERGEYDGSEWWEFKKLPTQFSYLLPTPAHILREL